jgi:hypothetical protein
LEEQITNQQAGNSKKDKETSKLKNSKEFISKTNPPLIYNPPIPFSQTLKNNILDNEFPTFLSIFKQIHILILHLLKL